MARFELKLWRRGMNWDQERAAEKLGVSVRSYKRNEKTQNIAKLIELATFALSIKMETGQSQTTAGNELFTA